MWSSCCVCSPAVRPSCPSCVCLCLSVSWSVCGPVRAFGASSFCVPFWFLVFVKQTTTSSERQSSRKWLRTHSRLQHALQQLRRRQLQHARESSRRNYGSATKCYEEHLWHAGTQVCIASSSVWSQAASRKRRGADAGVHLDLLLFSCGFF